MGYEAIAESCRQECAFEEALVLAQSGRKEDRFAGIKAFTLPLTRYQRRSTCSGHTAHYSYRSRHNHPQLRRTTEPPTGVTASHFMANQDQFTGCFAGLALGDALGAPFEGGLPERLLWRLIGRTGTGKRRYTDDTRMSLDAAESICRSGGVNQDDIALTFAAGYRWSRGYGAGTARMLKKIKKGSGWQEVNRARHPEGSYGNGAAMRAPIAALAFYDDNEQIIRAVQQISEVTHVHPQAQEGAALIALATSCALSRIPADTLFSLMLEISRLIEFQVRLQQSRQWISTQENVAPAVVVQHLGNGMAAVDSCVTALYIAVRHIDLPFSTMLEFIRRCSGDTDTIGAMAGAVWGAYNGITKLPAADLAQLESAREVERLATQLYNGYAMSRRNISLCLSS